MILYCESVFIIFFLSNYINLKLTSMFTLDNFSTKLSYIVCLAKAMLLLGVQNFVNVDIIGFIVFNSVLILIELALLIKNFSIKNLIMHFLIHILFSILLCAFCYVMFIFLKSKLLTLRDCYVFFASNLTCFIVILCIHFVLFRIIKNFIYKKKIFSNFKYKLKIESGNQSLNVDAYFDSGNLLKDPINGDAVIVLGMNSFLKMFAGEITIIDFLTKNLPNKLDGSYIKFNTVGKSKNEMFVFYPSCYLFSKDNNLQKINNVCVGVCFNKSFTSQNFDALIGPYCI